MENADSVENTQAVANMGTENQDLLTALSELTIFLMGGSFIAGSLFTVLCLLILDFMRRNKPNAESTDS